MIQKPLLNICILYGKPLSSDVTKKLFQLIITYKTVINIHINEANAIRNLIVIPAVSYNPMLDTEFSFLIKNQYHLDGILVRLICFALDYLNQTGYHRTGDFLKISVPSDDGFYILDGSCL